MTPERWRQVRDVFERALACEPGARAAAVAEACASDPSLAFEVEALLEAHTEASGFLNSAPRARFSVEPLIGRSLGRYQIQSALGMGGMGIVYRAYDPRLDRYVALKILPPEGMTGTSRERFLEEAKAASALNHPNIVTIYDSGAEDGVHFIAMELVHGETLAAAIAGGRLRAEQALDYAIQIAGAMAAAHAAGIVHRDIKPGNIMVTGEGRIKVLDFGLVARGTGSEDGGPRGTPSYMAPEQVRGAPADARSDIFSFGCTWFEMLTGERAFPAGGGRPAERRPQAGLPAPLVKCLEREPERRFQTAKELVAALIAFRGAGARRRRRLAITFAVSAVASAAACFVWLWPHPPPGSSRWVQLTRLPDSVSQPALSPDQRKLTFVRGPDTFAGSGQIYVKPLPAGDPVQLTHDTLQKMSPVFSPDGSEIAYTTVNRENQWDTWVVPAAGGEPRRWLANASGLVWFGKRQILFSEIKDHDVHMAIVAAGEDRAGAHDVYVPEDRRAMAHRSYPSPDARWVLLVEMDNKAAWLPCRLVPMDGGSRGRQVGPAGAGCKSAAWSLDGKWMYVSAGVGGAYHVWRQRFPDGAPEQVTSGPTEEEGIAMEADGRGFITSVGLRQSPVWIHDANGDRQVSLEGYSYDPKFTPDGKRLCFRVLKGEVPSEGPSEVRVLDLETGQSENVLPGLMVLGGSALVYDISPDGRLVTAVARGRDGAERVWVAPLDRSAPPRAVGDIQGGQPQFTHDGRIVFRRGTGAESFVYSVNPDGTDARRVADLPVVKIFGLSADNQWLVGKFLGTDGSAVTAYPLRGGAPVTISPAGSLGVVLKWSADRKWVHISWPTSMFWEHGGRTYAVPLAPGRVLPPIPAGGFASERDVAALPGARRIPMFDVAPGPSPDVYAYAQESSQRNLFRVPLR